MPHVVHLVGILIVGLVEVEVHGDLVLGAGLEVWKETLKLRRVLQIIVQSEQMWFAQFSFILDLELDDASAESGDDDLGRVLLADYLDVVERVDGVALVDLVVLFFVEEDARLAPVVVRPDVENRQLLFVYR